MKATMQKHLEKIYHPSNDKIIEGLSQFNENDSTNVLQGHEQSIEMTHLLQKQGQDAPSSINAAFSGLQIQDTVLVDQNQWAQEVRKADERCQTYHNAIQELQHRLASEQQFTQDLAAKIKVRDDEILRLHDLYQPAQNLEKINLKYQHEQAERAITKLQNQVDFLNKENIKLDRQVQILKGDENGNLASAQYDAMKRDLDDLMFENDRLRKDYTACTEALKETQITLHQKMEEEQQRIAQERQHHEMM